MSANLQTLSIHKNGEAYEIRITWNMNKDGGFRATQYNRAHIPTGATPAEVANRLKRIVALVRGQGFETTAQ